METENKLMQNILSANILKEIETLPIEFKEKSKQVKILNTEINDLDSIYKKTENNIDRISKEIINIENTLSFNLEEIRKVKLEQKLKIESITEESFKNFNKNFYKIPNNFQQIILIFLNYEGELKDQLNFLLLKHENLIQLLKDSYSYFKSLEEFDKEKYESCRDKIKKFKNENNLRLSWNKLDNNNQRKLQNPFDIIIEFIDNTFKIIDEISNNKKLKENIMQKSSYKGNLFIQNKLLKQEIKEKQETLKNINIYINYMNNILIKYKNFSNISCNEKSNNTAKPKTKLENILENNIVLEGKQSKSLIINNKNDNNEIIINSKVNTNEKLKDNNKEMVLKSSVINNENSRNKIEKIEIMKEDKYKDKNKFNDMDFVDNSNNNFYYAVNNCKKKDSTANIQPISEYISNNPNNIKVISIINTSKKNLVNSFKSDTDNSNKLNSYIIDYNNKSQKSPSNNPNIISNINGKEGKKIKINLSSINQYNNLSKNRNKFIKTNSSDQIISKKLNIQNKINPKATNEQNTSYHEINNIPNKEINNQIYSKINFINLQNNDKNLIDGRKPLCFSFQINNEQSIESGNFNNNNPKIKKNEGEIENKNKDYIKKIIDNESKGNNAIKKIKYNLSPLGIYNNSRKIIDKNKINDFK
jgi:hypothetical protein